MNPGKPLVSLQSQPIDGRIHHLFGFSFRRSEGESISGGIIFVIHIESLGEAETGIEGKGADKGAGGISFLFQVLGKGELPQVVLENLAATSAP